MPIRLSYVHSPHPEKPLNSAASVLMKIVLWPKTIVFEIIPDYIVGIKIYILLKVCGEYAYLPNPRLNTLLPTNLS